MVNNEQVQAGATTCAAVAARSAPVDDNFM